MEKELDSPLAKWMIKRHHKFFRWIFTRNAVLVLMKEIAFDFFVKGKGRDQQDYSKINVPELHKFLIQFEFEWKKSLKK